MYMYSLARYFSLSLFFSPSFPPSFLPPSLPPSLSPYLCFNFIMHIADTEEPPSENGQFSDAEITIIDNTHSKSKCEKNHC